MTLKGTYPALELYHHHHLVYFRQLGPYNGTTRQERKYITQKHTQTLEKPTKANKNADRLTT